MNKINYENLLDEEDFYGENNFYLLKNKSDLAEFINKEYVGRIEQINKIPINKWFLYFVDDSGDNTIGSLILVEDCKESLLKTIIETTKMYDFINKNCV